MPIDAGLEDKIRSLADDGDTDGAVTALIEGYGGELGGFLAATLRDPTQAAEAFSQFCEDAWRGLPSFRFESSVRTWAYVVARRAAWRVRRGKAAVRAELPLSVAGPASRIAAEVEESTVIWLRATVKDRLRALREALDEEDQELLTLRVDRDLDWMDVARVMADADDDQPSDDELRRRSASLRKRFERLKERLRKLAQAEGLLP